MRTLITFLMTALTISACHGQSGNAIKDQQTVYKELDDMKARGLMPAAEGGATMTCLIDGKPWKASGLYPIDLSDRIAGMYKDAYISFPVPRLEAGTKHQFSEHFAVDFSPANDPDFWGGRSGGIEITKVADGWVEGKFFFTATVLKKDRKMEITNGFFRVSQKKR